MNSHQLAECSQCGALWLTALWHISRAFLCCCRLTHTHGAHELLRQQRAHDFGLATVAYSSNKWVEIHQTWVMYGNVTKIHTWFMIATLLCKCINEWIYGEYIYSQIGLWIKSHLYNNWNWGECHPVSGVQKILRQKNILAKTLKESSSGRLQDKSSYWKLS